VSLSWAKAWDLIWKTKTKISKGLGHGSSGGELASQSWDAEFNLQNIKNEQTKWNKILHAVEAGEISESWYPLFEYRT
jgi:hypothetical protein